MVRSCGFAGCDWSRMAACSWLAVSVVGAAVSGRHCLRDFMLGRVLFLVKFSFDFVVLIFPVVDLIWIDDIFSVVVLEYLFVLDNFEGFLGLLRLVRQNKVILLISSNSMLQSMG